MTLKHLLLVFSLLLQACTDGQTPDDFEPDERTPAMPLNSNSYSQMLSENPEMVMVVPPSPGISTAWSGSPNLGALCDYAPDVHGRQTILKLDEWGYPEVWTVALTLDSDEYDAAVGGSVGINVTAEITYGSGGASHTFEMDWRDGARIALPMDSLQVNAKYSLSSDAFGELVPPPNLKLGVQLARGSCVSNATLTRRISYDVSAAQDSTIDIGTIPPLAKDFALFNSNVNYSALGGVTCSALTYQIAQSAFPFGSISRNLHGASVVEYAVYPVLGGERFMRLYVDITATVLSTQFIGIVFFLG